MTTFDYARTRATADKLLKYFGMSAVLRREGIPDRVCIVAITDYSPRDASSQLANPTDRHVIMSAATPEIQALPPNNELDQLVTFIQPGGTVVNEILPFTCPAKPIAPAGVPVLYEFTVRR